jgi:hypothetical protein
MLASFLINLALTFIELKARENEHKEGNALGIIDRIRRDIDGLRHLNERVPLIGLIDNLKEPKEIKDKLDKLIGDMSIDELDKFMDKYGYTRISKHKSEKIIEEPKVPMQVEPKAPTKVESELIEESELVEEESIVEYEKPTPRKIFKSARRKVSST